MNICNYIDGIYYLIIIFHNTRDNRKNINSNSRKHINWTPKANCLYKIGTQNRLNLNRLRHFLRIDQRMDISLIPQNNRKGITNWYIYWVHIHSKQLETPINLPYQSWHIQIQQHTVSDTLRMVCIFIQTNGSAYIPAIDRILNLHHTFFNKN